MLTNDFLTVKEIAKLRGVSRESVYKLVRKLRKKGYITRSFTRGLKKLGGSNPPRLKIRLHGQQFKIKILMSSAYYKKILRTKNQMFIDSNTVDLYGESIIVSCNELRDFWGNTADEAKTLSSKYWNDIFFRLQDRLKVIILKGENTQIRQFNGHFSEVDNELAKKCNEEKAKIMIRGQGDNLVWLIADKSWDMNELETVHPEKAQKDMQNTVQPFFNELRNMDGYTPKWVTNMLGELVRDRKEYAEQHATHIKSVQILGQSVQILGHQIKRLKTKLDQKKLKEWF